MWVRGGAVTYNGLPSLEIEPGSADSRRKNKQGRRLSYWHVRWTRPPPRFDTWHLWGSWVSSILTAWNKDMILPQQCCLDTFVCHFSILVFLPFFFHTSEPKTHTHTQNLHQSIQNFTCLKSIITPNFSVNSPELRNINLFFCPENMSMTRELEQFRAASFEQETEPEQCRGLM